MKAFATLAPAALLVIAQCAAAFADDDPHYAPGPWHYRAVSCADTTVSSVRPRLQNTAFTSSGVDVTFATTLGVRPVFSHGFAEVVHYQDAPGNATMAAERPGDRVQVCFLGGPAPTIYCNPDTDPRGRTYRVYDYRLKAQYWGSNDEHDCGGA